MADKVRYFLKLSYNGTEFHGWQRQDDVISIQQEIEEKLSTILRTETAILGCGRTDTGVHAREFFAHFDADSIELEFGLFVHKLNTMLPWGIAIQQLIPVASNAHARFDATKRSYEYLITEEKDPFLKDEAYRFNQKLDIDSMNKACQRLLGEHDFGCFCKSRADNHTNICTVYNAGWMKDANIIRFNITANRFLRNMVRAIVGTMLEIGQGRTSLADFDTILESKDRQAAGRSVPAHGLYLTKVEYPSTTFLSIP